VLGPGDSDHGPIRPSSKGDCWASAPVKSENGGTGANKPLYLGHPEFEGFTVLQEVKA